MPHFVVHHKGAFGIFSTVCDAMIRGPLTEAEMRNHLRRQMTVAQEEETPIDSIIETAKQKGTTSYYHASLNDTIRHNRNGPNETRMKIRDLIAEYLTLPDAGERVRKERGE